MTDALAAELTELGIPSREDDAAGPARAGAGNLIAHVPPAGDAEDAEWVSFFAHVDTVPHDEPIVGRRRRRRLPDRGRRRSSAPTTRQR